jgi:uncharacterized protein
MNPETTKIIGDLKQRLTNQLKHDLKDVILFGSQISCKNTQDSDYDILIILKEKPDWKLERTISDICYEIDLQYGIFTDIHILHENELSTLRGKQPIYSNAIKEGLHA